MQYTENCVYALPARIMNIAKIVLRNIRYFEGMEGDGYSVDICLGRKKLGEALDPATGGPVEFYFSDAESEKKFHELVKAYDDKYPGMDTFGIFNGKPSYEEIVQMKNLRKELPRKADDDQETREAMFIYNYLNLYNEYKKALKAFRKKKDCTYTVIHYVYIPDHPTKIDRSYYGSEKACRKEEQKITEPHLYAVFRCKEDFNITDHPFFDSHDWSAASS